jgi:hypothetical protein
LFGEENLSRGEPKLAGRQACSPFKPFAYAVLRV